MIDKGHIRHLLQSIVTEHADSDTRVRVRHELRTSTDKELVGKALLECLNDPDFKVQCEAIGLLARIDQAKYLPIILTKLGSEHEEVNGCICCLVAMDLKPDVRAVEPLMQVLRTDPDGTVRWWAAYALGVIGDERALPALEWARDHDPGVDFEGRTVSASAADAINMIGRTQS